jgi:hypothetical protein
MIHTQKHSQPFDSSRKSAGSHFLCLSAYLLLGNRVHKEPRAVPPMPCCYQVPRATPELLPFAIDSFQGLHHHHFLIPDWDWEMELSAWVGVAGQEVNLMVTSLLPRHVF